MAEKGIFVSVLPRLEAGAVGAAINALTNVFTKAGKSIEDSFKGPQNALKALQADMVRAQNAATEASIRADRRARDAELSAKRLDQIRATATEKDVLRVEAAENRKIIKYREAELAQKRAVEAQNVAADAAAAHAAGAANLASSVNNAGRAFNVVGAGSLAAFGVALDKTGEAASNFERTQTRLVTSAGEQKESLGLVSDGLLKMAGEVGVTAQELSKGMYTIESAGIHGADALTVMKAAAQGMAIEGGDLKDITNAITTSLHDYHLPADQAAIVTSKMITAVAHGKTSFGEFTEALHNVEPAAAKIGISMEDLFATMATGTAAGESALQFSQHMNDAINHLAVPTSQMREELAQMGFDARDLSTSLDKDGLGGTMIKLSEAITRHMTPSGKVAVSAFQQQAQVAEAAQEAYDKLPDRLKKIADQFKNNEISYKEWRKTAGGAGALDKLSELDTFVSLTKKANGFSQAIKSGEGDLQNWLQAMKKMVGDMPSLDVALMMTGKNAEYYNKALKDIQQTQTEDGNNVKGMSEAQETAAQKWNELKATLSALSVEMGNAFLPALKDVADVLKGVVHIFSEHPALARTVVDALALMGTAWLGLKAKMALDAVFLALTKGFGAVAASSAATTTAVVADSAVQKTAIATTTAAAVDEGVAITAVGTKSTATAAAVEASSARQVTALGGVMGKLSGLIGLLGEVGIAWMAADMAAKPLEEWMDKHSDEYHNSRIPTNDGGNLYTEGAFFGLFGPDGASQGQSQGESHPGLAPKDPRSAVDRLLNPGGGGSYGLLGLQPSQQNGAPLAEPVPDWVKNTGLGGLLDAAKAVKDHAPKLDQNPLENVPGPVPGVGGKKDASKKDQPAGVRNDPLYVSPADISDFNSEGGSANGSSLNYDPFNMSGGFTLPNLARLAATFLGNLALGNPYGQLRAGLGGGGEGGLDLAGAASQIESMTPQQRQQMQATIRTQKAVRSYEKALREYAKAVQKFGPGSLEAMNAEDAALNAKENINSVLASGANGAERAANVAGRQGVISGSGYTTDADLLAHIPLGGKYEQTQMTDLTKGLGDCSSAVADLVRIMDGEPTSGRAMSTADEGKWLMSHGFQPGMGGPGDFRVGFNGGHTQATLPGGTNFNWGNAAAAANRGQDGSQGAYDPAFNQHYFRHVTGGGGGGGGFAPLVGGALENPGLTSPSPLGGGPEQGPGIPGNPGTPAAKIPQGVGGMGGIGPGGRPAPASGRMGPTGNQSRQPGMDNHSKGFGVSGGAIGTAESAAAMALNALAPGSGEAAQMAMQLMNRAIGYGGQLAGIGVEGLLETFALNDSPIADPTKSLFGKVAMGFAGAHPTAPNVAGQTAPPLKQDDGQDQKNPGEQGPPAPLVNIENQNIQQGDGGEAARDTARTMNQFQGGGAR